MSRVVSLDQPLPVDEEIVAAPDKPIGLLKVMNLLGITDTETGHWVEKLPFNPRDATAGTETELQVAVVGKRQHVDLAQMIEHSNYFKNIVRRTTSGDAPKRALAALENYLDSSENVWENSWVRFPGNLLNQYAQTVFETDLLADKRRAEGPRRCDAKRFILNQNERNYLRIPISYLLKLALAQAIGGAQTPELVRGTGEKMMAHFLNDNTSPETHSFYTARAGAGVTIGRAAAEETLLRYLLTQLLVQYANKSLGLITDGQQAQVYFAPHPPVRQKQLNELISDAFYRELFMSPCLSGWAQGEAKHQYMILCHEVLSRSQLNALAKLKEAGIIANNLVVLPNTSNICLANNGIHMSLGSRMLTRMTADPACAYSHVDEKHLGDLVIKIMEHFLPLFVGTYSAAPYRFDFCDFHPERALGFLPHELDYTHLRMLWRRWKKKAAIKFLGHAMTPFGPEWLDRTISRLLGLRGDLIKDYRLVDYLVALLSTDESPSLDGAIGNDDRLKADLAAMGVFDARMPLYSLMRLRHYGVMGFSGYEARYYSLFERVEKDMSAATDLQVLLTMLAYKYIFRRHASHAYIPDSPTAESERRQIFFGAAIGIPTFYIRKNTSNRFLAGIVASVRGVRASRRYSGYLRVPCVEYQRALISLLRKDAQDLIDMFGLERTVTDLEARINDPCGHAVSCRLTARIIGGGKDNPMRWRPQAFNRAAETYYRTTLRKRHTEEAFDLFRLAAGKLDSWPSWRGGRYNQALLKILDGKNARSYLSAVKNAVLDESLPADACERLIHILLLVFDQGKQLSEKEDAHHS